MEDSASNALRSALGTSLGIGLLFLATPTLAQADPGDLDRSFGNRGKVITPFSEGFAVANDLAIQSDGKIVLAGAVESSFALARYRRDGTLDTSFGDGGVVITSFPNESGSAVGVAIQGDGKIVVTGRVSDDLAIARYLEGGGLDSSLGGSGVVRTSFTHASASGSAILIQPDGRIVVAGWAGREFVVARFRTNGALDRRFSGDGRVRTDAGAGKDYAIDLALQSDRNLVVVGKAGYAGFALVRYRRDGELDRSFGEGGKVRTTFGENTRASANAVAIQENGKIVAAGWAGRNFVKAALARYEADGSLDSTFSADGVRWTNFGRNAEAAEAVAIQPNGRIVIAGMATYYERFALARYMPDGSLDTSFGVNGLVQTRFAGGFEVAWGIALEPNGKIVAGGEAGGDFAMARYAS